MQDCRSQANSGPGKKAAREFFGVQARNLAKLNAAGAKIVFGTDSGTSVGWTVHTELADMVTAGMTPQQVNHSRDEDISGGSKAGPTRRRGCGQERRLHRARRESSGRQSTTPARSPKVYLRGKRSKIARRSRHPGLTRSRDSNLIPYQTRHAHDAHSVRCGAAGFPQRSLSGNQPDRSRRCPAVLRDYQPVTAERLKNPEAGNWLMIRRTYDGWGYSPLDQITPANVARLKTEVGVLDWRRASCMKPRP